MSYKNNKHIIYNKESQMFTSKKDLLESFSSAFKYNLVLSSQNAVTTILFI